MRKDKLLHPLSEFYKLISKPFPLFRLFDGHQIPQPYEDLLVHDRDMTPTLENFHKQKIHLGVQKKIHKQDSLMRQVVLLNEAEEPVEFGAIRIALKYFSKEAQTEILCCRNLWG
jgi:hypothetical protein